MNSIKKPIVIVGAGFAGITVALNLKKINPSIPILVVDYQLNFIFKPLMYELLSQEISSWEISQSFESLLDSPGITFIKNQLVNVDFSKNLLYFIDDLKIEYGNLVLCTGSTPQSYSIKGVQENCSFFNDIEHLDNLKSTLDHSVHEKIKNNLFIVGAGPSGIELACKIYDLYGNKFQISIIERSNEILSKNKIFNREEAEKAIEKRGIQLLLNSQVKEVTPKEISVIDNKFVSRTYDTNLVIWTAGVKANLPGFIQEIPILNGRIIVKDTLQMDTFQNVFAIGDIAIIKSQPDLPITAQTAMQQGFHVAKNIDSLVSSKKASPFVFEDNGEMISLGMGNASISSRGLTLSGKFAFEMRRIIYASKMPKFDNRLRSAASWLFDKKSIFDLFSIQKSNKS